MTILDATLAIGSYFFPSYHKTLMQLLVHAIFIAVQALLVKKLGPDLRDVRASVKIWLVL
eukprot:snap_masked-scaffold_2-processed-gene-25.28-mRNA-1 protein AED:1.00 eAED:1.00 QI:0/0/0/0/1/1/2/0/59